MFNLIISFFSKRFNHRKKNIESRKHRAKSKRAHLRELQRAYNFAKFRERLFEKEVSKLQMELFSLRNNINDSSR
jgi:predicted  nucleic acid-binding Zn-ribbon protein